MLAALFLAQTMNAQSPASSKDPVDWMNPLMGTDSKFSLSNGNTYPAIALPWGMNFWSPQTGRNGDGWMYTYESNHIRGIKQTHQPSPWINDYGMFSLMPVTGHLKFREEDRQSWFSHKTEIAKPYYYHVYLADPDVVAEVTPTTRAAELRFTFPDSDSSFIVLDAFDKGSYVKILPGQHKVIGYSTRNSGGVPDNFKNYFVLYFDKPFTATYTWSDTALHAGQDEMKGDHVGAVLQFKTQHGEKIQVRVASSFISAEQAELNLQREIGRKSFDEVKAMAKAAWDKELDRIRVEDDNPEHIRTFYSCLYRMMLFPRKFYEINADNEVVHYSPYNGKTEKGYLFTDCGFWDTFRAVFPFFTLMHPTLDAHMMEGLANAYKESGWLPEWASPGHRDCMIGSNSAAIIADAYTKGIRGYDIQTLYQGILKNTENEGPLSSVGRKGVKYYNELGYVPYDVDIHENAARTLEYAYDDFTIMKLAQTLGRPEEEVMKFAHRAMNYRHLFDPTHKLMRGKNKDGSFESPFNPFKWGDAFTEGNSWHYTWSVFQDIRGLEKLMGGRTEFVTMLDSVFKMPPTFDDSYYGGVIHEIREMQIVNMGQYAHGNQPIQHMLYLYNYAGEPWKTQYWVRQTMEKLYQPTPDGYCGDEDNGQTSAWYVFSAMGFYPVCPGSGQYVLGAPLVKKITLKLENGKTFAISAPQNDATHIYVKQLLFNGKQYDKNWISHADIMKGGTLQFVMDTTPNKERGTRVEDAPYSLSEEMPALQNMP